LAKSKKGKKSKSVKKWRRTDIDKRELKDKIRSLNGRGKSDHQICQRLDIEMNILQIYRNEIVEEDTYVIQHITPESAYCDYLEKMGELLRQLQKEKRRASKLRQMAATMAAIKLQADLYDRCVKLGQEFGFLEKKASEIKISQEFKFSEMSDKELKKAIQDEFKGIQDLVKNEPRTIRPELLGLSGGDISEFIPADVAVKGKPKKTKVKTKIRVVTRKRF